MIVKIIQKIYKAKTQYNTNDIYNINEIKMY